MSEKPGKPCNCPRCLAELAAAEERGRRAGINNWEAAKDCARALAPPSVPVPLPLANRILAALEVWGRDPEREALASDLRAAVERKP